MLKINARECIIKEVPITDEIEFLNDNHKQNYVVSSVCYGLYHNNKLVQLMSFGKPRYTKKYQWEIIRDCTKKNYIVRGGVSKLWKYFIKEQNPVNVICYSYPHNGEFTSKYIDNCDFNNKDKSVLKNHIYWVGKHNNKEYEIPLGILRVRGVDAILGTNFGKDNGTNEEILKSLNFKRIEREEYSPQVDTWFKGGCVYRMEIIGTDKFYIGETTQNIESYWGSGKDWNRYLDTNNIPRDGKHINKIVLKDNFKDLDSLLKYEVKEIQKYCDIIDGKLNILPEYKGKCLNVSLANEYPFKLATCPECGHMPHTKQCSKYIEKPSCSECGGLNGNHRKGCSKYTERRACPECGGKGTHKKSCSKAASYEICPECGGKRIHKKTCSFYPRNKLLKCKECGSIHGQHKKSCSQYTKRELCSECGGLDGHHKSWCSKFKELKICPECGGKRVHKKNCSKFKQDICIECGSPNTSHKKTCSKYSKKVCPECGGVNSHFDTCSKSKGKCPECGYSLKSNRHAKSCSKYKEPKVNKCSECGSKTIHKSWCSKHKN